MRAWNAQTAEEQEKVIGRMKLSSLELPGDVKPANSHVALTTVTGPDGTGRQILRSNTPFGCAGRGEFGTYFIGYAATPAVTEQMLANMFIGDPPGNYDRLLDFSTAVTGGLFFVPAAGFLDDPPGPPGRAAAVREPLGRPAATAAPGADGDGATAPSAATSGSGGSLRIRSLRRSTQR